MAERETTLRMTTSEEAALARLIKFLCREELERGYLSTVFGYNPRSKEPSPSVEAIGRINAALNANR